MITQTIVQQEKNSANWELGADRHSGCPIGHLGLDSSAELEEKPISLFLSRFNYISHFFTDPNIILSINGWRY